MEEGKRLRESWDAAHTCNTVGDLPSIVQKPELLPPQRLASFLVSKLVPGEEKNSFMRDKEQWLWGFTSRTTMAHDPGAGQNEHGGERESRFLFFKIKS